MLVTTSHSAIARRTDRPIAGLQAPHNSRPPTRQRPSHRTLGAANPRIAAHPTAGSGPASVFVAHTNPQPLCLCQHTSADRDRFDQGLQKARFSRAIWSNNGNNLTPRNTEINAVQHPRFTVGDGEALGGDQRCHGASIWQFGQSPSASIVARSIWNSAACAVSINAVRTEPAGASATASHLRQIRKAGT